MMKENKKALLEKGKDVDVRLVECKRMYIEFKKGGVGNVVLYVRKMGVKYVYGNPVVDDIVYEWSSYKIGNTECVERIWIE